MSQESLQRVLTVALRFLNRRERTVGEVRQRLEREVADPAVVDEAIETLQDQGLLDDHRYARLFAEEKRELGSWGEERIRRALIQRGIERELIDAALQQVDGDERQRAAALLARRFPEPPRDRRGRERALRLLLHKGYGSELALEVLNQFAREGPQYYDAA